MRVPTEPPGGTLRTEHPGGSLRSRCCMAGVAEPGPPPARPARRARPRGAALPRPHVLKNALIPTASRDSAVFFCYIVTTSFCFNPGTPNGACGLWGAVFHVFILPYVHLQSFIFSDRQTLGEKRQQ